MSANMLCTLHDFKDGVSRDSCKVSVFYKYSKFLCVRVSLAKILLHVSAKRNFVEIR